ncbi:Ig-like domain-containing protein [Terrisporobacter petrolearius]|uniref:Ig-like domain-containing protein n=1 Tax=Terrisporobacter petrolearius TaxID=1460447 RepID=UPI0031CCD580
MKNKIISKILSVLMAFMMIISVVPTNVFADNTNSKSNSIEIKEDDLNGNQYETYYYVENENYTYKGKRVEFISEKQIKVGDETLNLKNKKTTVNIKVEGDKATIAFTGINTPIGSVSGQWNSAYAGETKIYYDSDIEGQAKITSKNYDLKTLEIKGLTNGTYHLTNGSIYEKANEWSPGISGIGTEGYFGRLPDIIFTVGSDQEQPVGKVNLSIEKRTIGKGDTLSMEEVDMYEGDTAWDVLKRESEARGIELKYTHHEAYNSVYVSSIAGDGEFDHGQGSGWKYEVNGIFPDVGLSAYKLKVNDTVRLRYCITVGSEELNNPLVDYLKQLIADAQDTIKNGNYASQSIAKVNTAIKDAKVITSHEQYNSKDTDKELVVSKHIKEINDAVTTLEKEDTDHGGDVDAPSNVPDDFENDLWLQYDYKELKVNGTATIYPRRVPQIIDDPISNYVTRPNFNFQIISGDSISLDTTKSTDKATVTAVKEGTSIVKVTYDACGSYGASSIVNTAYVVYDVVGDANTGITINSNIKETSYDTIYYKEGSTVDYEIDPTITGADTVEVTCNGNVVTEKNGKYTAKLENRSNIIGIKATNSKGTKSYYKVVDARKIEVSIVNSSRPGATFEAGDTAKISFKGITHPVYKLATIYNPTWQSTGPWPSKGTFVEYKNDVFGTVKGYCNQWDLATVNTIKVTFDKSGEYKFNSGKIFSEWWGSELGADKGQEGSGEPNLGALQNSRYFSSVPNFTINVASAEYKPVESVKINEKDVSIEVTGETKLTATVLPENATDKVVTWSSDNEEVATVDQNGVIKGLKEGNVTIIVTTKDSNKTHSITVKVTPEKPANDEERESLKALIEEVESMNESKYTEDTWLKLQEQLKISKEVYNNEKSLINEINNTTKDLQQEIDNLKKAINVTISPKRIEVGDEVTIKFTGLEVPDISNDGNGNSRLERFSLMFNTNMPGVSQAKSENAITNSELIKTIKFTVPEDTKAGEYTLSDGYIEAYWRAVIHPNMPIELAPAVTKKYYENELPKITIKVVNVEEETTNKVLAQKVSKKIEAIDLTNGFSSVEKNKVNNAKNEFDKLSETQKSLVPKELHEKLNISIDKIKELEIDNFVNLVSKIERPATKTSINKVIDAAGAYSNMDIELQQHLKVQNAKNILNQIIIEISNKPEKPIEKEFKKVLSINNIKYNSTSIAGKGEAGAEVHAYVGSKLIGSSTVKKDGTYTIKTDKLTGGATIAVKMKKEGYKTAEVKKSVLKEIKKFTVDKVKCGDKKITGTGNVRFYVRAYDKSGKQAGSTVKVDSKGKFCIYVPKQAASKSVTVKISKSGYCTRSKTTKVLKVFSKKLSVNSIKSRSKVITGKGQYGATVRAYVNGKQIGKTIKVSKNNKFSVNIPKQKKNTKITIKMTKTETLGLERTIKVK